MVLLYALAWGGSSSADWWLLASPCWLLAAGYWLLSLLSAWWLVIGGWWLVVGGCWFVVGGWWLVAGGWWLAAAGPLGRWAAGLAAGCYLMVVSHLGLTTYWVLALLGFPKYVTSLGNQSLYFQKRS